MSIDSSDSLLELSNDFDQLLIKEQNYDVIIKAGDENDVQEFRVHALILITRSQYFRTALSDNWARKDGNVTILEKPNVSPKIFQLLLKYLYTGVINFDSLDGTIVLQVLIAADELYLDSLLNRVDNHLIRKHAEFLRKDPGQILQIIFKYEPCSKFRDLCLKTISFHLDPNDESISKSLPPRCLQSLPLFNSLIINQKHFSIITSWIEKQDSNYFEKRNLPYSFSLLLRASRDGLSSDKFHNLCDNKGPILIITKTRQNGQIIGGYCPIDFKPGLNVRHNESWLASQDSFIFSFPNNSNSNHLFRVVDSQKAIYYNPTTCIGFGLQDILLNNNQIRSLSDSSYSRVTNVLRGTHNLEDYEVFQVIKKL
ncbi:20872_t:CDS:2 [Dentiscutata erythropus]|uniref:20872_t:CDS:1 n=1 Tax=Dentiscutata erythropus TaxID=1348616 RepID=A0A9N9GQK8_9GLOM|nr:20872_t:CDS:2 [Dentiscutata erythropus]